MSGSTDIFGGPLTGSFDPALAQGFQALIGLLSQVAENTKKADSANKEAKSGWGDLTERARRAGEVYTDVVGSLRDIISTGGAAVTAIAALSSEQTHLSENSARLGLDFDEGAASVGRFADETEAMGAATVFASRNVRLTQEEFNALGRVVGAVSRDNFQPTRQTFNELTDAILNGTERGLRQFGPAMEAVAGPTHTVGERLAALTAHAREVTPATDDASDALERYKDVLGDAERTAASAFTTEISRLASLHTGFDQAHLDADELNRDVTAIGQTAAHMATVVGAAIGAVLGTVATGVRGVVAEIQGAVGMVERLRAGASLHDAAVGVRAEFFGPGSAFAQVNNARESAYDTLAGVFNDTGPANANTGVRHSAIGAEGMVFTNEQADANERDAAARGARGHGGGRGRSGRNRRANFTRTGELGMSNELGGVFDHEFGDQREAEGTDALMEQAGGRVLGIGAGGTSALGGALGQNVDEAPLDPMQQRTAQAAAQREQTLLERRYQMQRSFTDRTRDLFEEQTSNAQRGAESIKAAYDTMTGALGSHVGALLTGREGAKAAFYGFLDDMLGGWAKYASQMAVLSFAEAGLFAFTNPGAAAGRLAAGFGYLAFAAASGGLSQLIPDASGKGGAAGGAAPGGGSGAGRAADLRPRDGQSSAGAQTIQVNFGAPVFAVGNSRADVGSWMVGSIREAMVQQGAVLPTAVRR